MTLDELLALLPDNTTGEISAADLRTIVTDLFTAAHLTRDTFAYSWSTSGTAPASGRATTDLPWQLTATKILVSETTDDALTPSFTVLDRAADAKIWITNAAGASLEADVTGASVDLGTYREVPITVVSITGTQPTNNSAVTLTVATLQP